LPPNSIAKPRSPAAFSNASPPTASTGSRTRNRSRRGSSRCTSPRRRATSRALYADGVDFSARPLHYPSGESPEALLATFDASIAAARDVLASFDEARAAEPWRITFGDREIATMPRINVMRTVGLNHWYHHRGEFVVYLRLMDIPVPIVYGRSADESPF
jgi:hypothetical protein